MRKQLLVAVLVVGALALVGSAASAQAPVSTVKVPFQFIVGDTVLPAGLYSVTTIGEGLNMLCVRSEDGKSVATAIVNLADPSKLSNTKFEFNKVGGQYFLSSVSRPGVPSQVVPLPSERVDAVLAKLNGTKAPRTGHPTVLR